MRFPALSENDVLSLTLLLALVLHAALLAINFQFEDRADKRSEQGLEITLVRHPRPAEPADKPDFLAQTSQQGGGEQEEKALPKTQLAPLTEAPEPFPSREQQEVGAPLPAKPQEPVLENKPEHKPVPKKQRSDPAPRKTSSTANLLAARDREIQRLTAELDMELNNNARRPRRKFVSASTQEYKYASYLHAWRKKVEQIGTLNFPDEAKRNQLYGNLVLLVSLNSDGTIHRIELRKSSGHKVLDDAAIRIVRLAAPFAPFPANIAEETDILDITRTWQFVSGKPLFNTN
jgi:periplasmic protein TonB